MSPYSYRIHLIVACLQSMPLRSVSLIKQFVLRRLLCYSAACMTLYALPTKGTTHYSGLLLGHLIAQSDLCF